MSDAVLISRTTGGDTSNGQPVPHRGDGRVFITRVYRDQPQLRVFSSTTDWEKAERFSQGEAERLVASSWRDRDPRIEDAS